MLLLLEFLRLFNDGIGRLEAPISFFLVECSAELFTELDCLGFIDILGSLELGIIMLVVGREV